MSGITPSNQKITLEDVQTYVKPLTERRTIREKLSSAFSRAGERSTDAVIKKISIETKTIMSEKFEAEQTKIADTVGRITELQRIISYLKNTTNNEKSLRKLNLLEIDINYKLKLLASDVVFANLEKIDKDKEKAKKEKKEEMERQMKQAMDFGWRGGSTRALGGPATSAAPLSSPSEKPAAQPQSVAVNVQATPPKISKEELLSEMEKSLEESTRLFKDFENKNHSELIQTIEQGKAARQRANGAWVELTWPGMYDVDKRGLEDKYSKSFIENDKALSVIRKKIEAKPSAQRKEAIQEMAAVVDKVAEQEKPVPSRAESSTLEATEPKIEEVVSMSSNEVATLRGRGGPSYADAIRKGQKIEDERLKSLSETQVRQSESVKEMATAQPEVSSHQEEIDNHVRNLKDNLKTCKKELKNLETMTWGEASEATFRAQAALEAANEAVKFLRKNATAEEFNAIKGKYKEKFDAQRIALEKAHVTLESKLMSKRERKRASRKARVKIAKQEKAMLLEKQQRMEDQVSPQAQQQQKQASLSGEVKPTKLMVTAPRKAVKKEVLQDRDVRSQLAKIVKLPKAEMQPFVLRIVKEAITNGQLGGYPLEEVVKAVQSELPPHKPGTQLIQWTQGHRDFLREIEAQAQHLPYIAAIMSLIPQLMIFSETANRKTREGFVKAVTTRLSEEAAKGRIEEVIEKEPAKGIRQTLDKKQLETLMEKKQFETLMKRTEDMTEVMQVEREVNQFLDTLEKFINYDVGKKGRYSTFVVEDINTDVKSFEKKIRNLSEAKTWSSEAKIKFNQLILKDLDKISQKIKNYMSDKKELNEPLLSQYSTINESIPNIISHITDLFTRKPEKSERQFQVGEKRLKAGAPASSLKKRPMAEKAKQTDVVFKGPSEAMEKTKAELEERAKLLKDREVRGKEPLGGPLSEKDVIFTIEYHLTDFNKKYDEIMKNLTQIRQGDVTNISQQLEQLKLILKNVEALLKNTSDKGNKLQVSYKKALDRLSNATQYIEKLTPSVIGELKRLREEEIPALEKVRIQLEDDINQKKQNLMKEMYNEKGYPITPVNKEKLKSYENDHKILKKQVLEFTDQISKIQSESSFGLLLVNEQNKITEAGIKNFFSGFSRLLSEVQLRSRTAGRAAELPQEMQPESFVAQETEAVPPKQADMGAAPSAEAIPFKVSKEPYTVGRYSTAIEPTKVRSEKAEVLEKGFVDQMEEAGIIHTDKEIGKAIGGSIRDLFLLAGELKKVSREIESNKTFTEAHVLDPEIDSSILTRLVDKAGELLEVPKNLSSELVEAEIAKLKSIKLKTALPLMKELDQAIEVLRFYEKEGTKLFKDLVKIQNKMNMIKEHRTLSKQEYRHDIHDQLKKTEAYLKDFKKKSFNECNDNLAEARMAEIELKKAINKCTDAGYKIGKENEKELMTLQKDFDRCINIFKQKKAVEAVKTDLLNLVSVAETISDAGKTVDGKVLHSRLKDFLKENPKKANALQQMKANLADPQGLLTKGKEWSDETKDELRRIAEEIINIIKQAVLRSSVSYETYIPTKTRESIKKYPKLTSLIQSIEKNLRKI